MCFLTTFLYLVIFKFHSNNKVCMALLTIRCLYRKVIFFLYYYSLAFSRKYSRNGVFVAIPSSITFR